MEKNSVYEQTSSLKKLHPIWIGFRLFKSIRSLILFIVFLFIVLDMSSNSIFSWYGTTLIGLFTVYQIGASVLEWYRFGYYFDQEEIYVQKGRFVKMKRFFPLDLVQGINQNTLLIHRMLGLTSLLIDVGSSDRDSSIKLEMITIEEAEQIKKILSKYGNIQVNEPVASDKDQKEGHKDKNFTHHYTIETNEILIASLTSLRLLFFLSVLYSVYSQLSQFLPIEEHINKAIAYFQTSIQMLLLGIALLILCSMIYGFVKTFIQYGGLVVTSDAHRIYLEKGIGSKTSFSIPKDNIQALSINSGFIHRMLKIVNVRLISATDVNDEDIKASNILFPFINRQRAFTLVPEVVPSFAITGSMSTIPKRSILVKLLRTMYIWLLLPLGIFLFIPGFWYIAVLAFVITLTSQIVSGLCSSYSLNGQFLQLRKVGVSTRLFIMRRDRIERIMLSETMIQRKMGLASLKVTTRARPTKVITMHDVPIQIALQCQSWFINED